MDHWLLYGANGYTGELTARRAVHDGMRPTLAGRREEAISLLARELDLPYRIFDLSDPAALREGLSGMEAVVHCAGPFSHTSKPMVDACLETGTHYLDITGEMAVFHAVFKRDEEAKKAGVVLMPGVGFDVVPTDCMAAMLFGALPDATHLELAFGGLGSISRGTLKTSVEGIAMGGWIREAGRLKSIPSGSLTTTIPFPRKPLHGVAIPWGDIATAYRTTGIKNIVVYAAFPKAAATWMRRTRWLNPLLGTGPAQWFLKKMVDRREPGPDANLREKGYSDIWGRVRNEAGEVWEGNYTTPEGYTLTARSALQCLKELGTVAPGSWTPAAAFGPELVTRIEGVTTPQIARVES